MPPGPAPTAPEVTKAKGNTGKRAAAPEVVDTTPESRDDPPAWMNEEGAAVWRELAPTLIRENRLKETDRGVFARYCEMTGLWRRLKQQVDKEPLQYDSTSNHGSFKRRNPTLGDLFQCERVLQSQDGKFGLTPADRQLLIQRQAGQQQVPGPLFEEPSREGPSLEDDLDAMMNGERVH